VAQVPKEEVRQAFVRAAGEAFAADGFLATTMADVAARAGSSVGNLYKYFQSKQALLDAVVPPGLVRELRRRTRARIRALGTARDVRELASDADYHAVGGELLDFCLQHRAAVVIVLLRGDGTPFAAFAESFVEQLTAWALEYASQAYPDLELRPALLFALRHAYRHFVSVVALALQEFPDETEARDVVALLTLQHQGGLKRLFESARRNAC
jgi:AcrR family transcriptional regulator